MESDDRNATSHQANTLEQASALNSANDYFVFNVFSLNRKNFSFFVLREVVEMNWANQASMKNTS
jgi:hypothetical protein